MKTRENKRKSKKKGEKRRNSVIIKNMTSLKKVLNDTLIMGLDVVGEKVQEEITKFITLWYQDYTPTRYKRTYQFLDSCTRTIPERNGRCWRVTVYIDTQSMKYRDSDGDELNPYDVLVNADKGIHGAGFAVYGNEEVGFWDVAIEEMRQERFVLSQFKLWLISAGFKVK